MNLTNIITTVFIGVLLPLSTSLATEQNEIPRLIEADSTSYTQMGTLEVMYGDQYDTISHKIVGTKFNYYLNTSKGKIFLDMKALDSKSYKEAIGKNVTLTLKHTKSNRKSVLAIDTFHIKESTIQGYLHESSAENKKKPWFNIMCKFSNIDDEPVTPSEIAGVFADSYPFLEDYWRTTTYGHVDIAGTETMDRWVTLPQPRSYYLKKDVTNTLRADLNALESDCKAAAGYADEKDKYYGTNLFFNGNLDGAAWGGQDVTWFPIWAHKSLGIIAHEMGHCYGLSHSSGSYGDSYDSPWDVMSSTSYGDDIGIYNSTPQHTIAFHKERLGAIEKQYSFTSNDFDTHEGYTVSLSQHEEAGVEGKYLIANIFSADGSKQYTVEARNQIGYDVIIPEKTVLIHEIKNGSRAYIIDDDNSGYVGDEGAQWKVGETFEDLENNIKIEIIGESDTGFDIRVYAENPVEAPVLLSIDEQKISSLTTNNIRPELRGTCAKGTKIYIVKNSTALASNTICKDNGTFVLKSEEDFDKGRYRINVMQNDEYTNKSLESNIISLIIEENAFLAPDYTVTLNATGTIINAAQGTVGMFIRVAETNGGSSTMPLQFTIVKNEHLKVNFDVNKTIHDGEEVNNNEWEIEETIGLYIFTYTGKNGIFSGNTFSKVGLSALFTTPSNAKGQFALDVTIANNPDEEVKINNKDTDYLEYNNLVTELSPT